MARSVTAPPNGIPLANSCDMEESFTSLRSFKPYTALGLWMLLAWVFFSLGKQWIAFTAADKQLTEYTDTLVRQAALQRRPAKDIRTLVMMKVEQLSIPAQNDQISVTGQGDTLRTVIAYDADIKIPVVDRTLYRMEFSHNLQTTLPR
jgi:hypothetical protein